MRLPPSPANLGFAAHHRVPRTQLFGLMNGLDACSLDFCAHFRRLIPHHDEHALGRRDLKGGVDGVAHQRLTPGPMQHFGHPRLHARTLPRGKNYNSGVIYRRLGGHDS